MSESAKQRYPNYQTRWQAIRAESWRGAVFGGKWMALILIAIDFILWAVVFVALIYRSFTTGIAMWHLGMADLPGLLLATTAAVALCTVYSALFGAVIMGAGAAVGYRRSSAPESRQPVSQSSIKTPDANSEHPGKTNLSWACAYFTVLELAILLIPFATYVAVVTTLSIAHVAKETNAAVGDRTAFFVWLGIPGLTSIGSTAILSIIALLPWRNKAWTAFVSLVILASCVIFCLFAALASHFPFWGIMWRLSG
jgi:hypothetical protein